MNPRLEYGYLMQRNLMFWNWEMARKNSHGTIKWKEFINKINYEKDLG